MHNTRPPQATFCTYGRIRILSQYRECKPVLCTHLWHNNNTCDHRWEWMDNMEVWTVVSDCTLQKQKNKKSIILCGIFSSILNVISENPLYIILLQQYTNHRKQVEGELHHSADTEDWDDPSTHDKFSKILYVGKSIIIRNVALNFISIQIENLH
jgi:hypothetical protein